MTSQHPHIIEKNGKSLLHVCEGIVTVLDPGDNPLLESGMMFIIERRDIIAETFDASTRKYRGSNSHHKYLVMLKNAKILTKIPSGAS